MELHQLRYLVAVADTGSFTGAAAQCHVTQPTLSHQIRKLEDEVGEPLLQRRSKGAQLTPLGQRVYHHAQEVLRGVESVRAVASSFAGRIQGLLRLGVIPTVAPYFVPGLLLRARKQHPGIQFQVSEEPTERLLASLLLGKLDLAILSPPVEEPRVQTHDLFVDDFLLALPRRHPLARLARVPLHRLNELPMILMNDAHCLRGQTISFCRRAGFVPRVLIESAQLDTVLAMVETGQGISLVPAMARRAFSHRRVVFRPLRPEKISRRIGLAWSRQAAPSRAFTAFVELCQGTPPGTPTAF
jgi:LysR family hydrogen peroxide-inducible transcriptional activator